MTFKDAIHLQLTMPSIGAKIRATPHLRTKKCALARNLMTVLQSRHGLRVFCAAAAQASRIVTGCGLGDASGAALLRGIGCA
jgi:hypothetical protein